MKRFLYFMYYLKQLNRNTYAAFEEFTMKEKSIGRWPLRWKIFANSIRYNVSILEFFQFHFMDQSPEQKLNWAGTGFMYEYQLKMNPKSTREVLDDKRQFAHKYKDFLVHRVFTTSNPDELLSKFKELQQNNGKMVLKSSDGKCGIGVEIMEANSFTGDLLKYMAERDLDILEEFIVQHSELNRLSPSGVNTVRIITQLDENNNVVYLGCRLRISVNSAVDNMAAGNLVAVIDEKTGQVVSKGYYSDITK